MPVTIPNGSKHMNVVTYTGNGSTQTISGLDFQPDFVWIKSRGGATWHNLYDVIRGTTKSLASNATDAEDTRASGLTAFTSSGFTLGSDANVNGSGTSYVAWCWKANGAGSSNTAGSITSTVSANPTAGFSVVKWTGTGSVGTIGHGLGVAPKMIIGKRTDGTSNWFVYHDSLGNTKGLNLNTTDAAGTNSGWWNNTSPTSSVFTIGSYETNSGSPFVAYCFSEVAGYSKFGSYTGNGNTSGDGTFVYLGFRPRFVMIKRTDTAGFGWYIRDTARDTYNVGQNYLDASSSASEGSGTVAGLDYLSNGFKLKNTAASDGINASGGTYIYMAFAESPFKYALGR